MKEKLILPKDEEKTLQDQDDVVIWMKFNILLQAVDEVTAEFGSATENPKVARVTRQLRVVTQEAVRRKMFTTKVEHMDPTDEQLWGWYEVLKQLVEGDNLGSWEKVGAAENEYRTVVFEMKDRGIEMPAQKVGLEALDMLGENIAMRAKRKEK